MNFRDHFLLGKAVAPVKISLFEKNLGYAFEEMALGIDEMKNLDPFDRRTLVTSNFSYFFSMICALFLNKVDLQKHIRKVLGYVQEHVSEDSIYSHVQNLFNQLTKSNRSITLNYEAMYLNPWSPNVNIENKQHKDLLDKIQVQ